MATWFPISNTVPQYVDGNGDPYSGAVLKFYAAGTSTVISLATDSTGGTTATSVALNAAGYPEISGNVVIPHLSQDYKITLYPTQAAADADSGAVWSVDSLSRFRFEQFVTPQQFGAVGDGVTDDDAAFVSAEAEAKLVFIPKTTNGYEMTSAVSTSSGAWLIDPTLTWSQWSDDGQLDLERGFYTGTGNGVNIWRFADRVFVGEAASENAGRVQNSGYGTTWIDYRELAFTSGGTYEVQVGDTLTGATSGTTAVVISITLDSGSWAGGDAAGTFVINFRLLAFVAENLDVGANLNVATIAADATLKYPFYIPRTATLLSSSRPTPTVYTTAVAVGAYAKTDTDTSSAIGFGAAVINEKGTTGGQAWAFIAEMQRESGSGFTAGLEANMKNKAGDTTLEPYQRFGGGSTFTAGTYGLWLVAGGSTTFGGDPANPSDTAIVITSRGVAGHTWNRGIVFDSHSVTSTDGVTGVGIAIQMVKGHTIEWHGPAGIDGVIIRSDVGTSGQDMKLIFDDNRLDLLNTASKVVFRMRAVASGVNYIDVLQNVTGAGAILSAQGDDTNIDLRFQSKGSGNIRYGTHSAIGAETVTGFITIKDDGGTSRKLAVVS